MHSLKMLILGKKIVHDGHLSLIKYSENYLKGLVPLDTTNLVITDLHVVRWLMEHNYNLDSRILSYITRSKDSEEEIIQMLRDLQSKYKYIPECYYHPAARGHFRVA